MVNYKLSKEADEDLSRLFDYGIDQFGLEQARSYIDGMKQRFSELTENPRLWQAVDSIRTGYRRSVYRAHSIYYRIDSDEIMIIRVLGRQDPKKLE